MALVYIAYIYEIISHVSQAGSNPACGLEFLMPLLCLLGLHAPEDEGGDARQAFYQNSSMPMP